MKRTISIMLLILVLAVSVVFAGGDKEEAKDEKIIRIAEQVPGLITPGVWDGQAFSMNGSIYEYLAEMNPDTGELEPLLATAWETEDGSTWKFTLRKGVKFHDGSDFNAQDVKYTIERTQDPTIGHLKKQDFEVVSSIETPDNHTIILHLDEPRPTFVYQLTDYNMAILSSEYDYASLGESKPMGTGPFMMQQLTPKESALLVRNPNYWAEGLPIVDKLAIYFVPDIDASISMLESGRVDVVPFITQVIKTRLEKNPDINVISPYQEMRFISMRVDEKPFNDNRVRLAFKYAMDPQIIARSVAQMDLNDGIFYNETPIMNILAEYKEIPLRGRDTKKAKALLAEAGYPNGVSVPMYYASDHPFGKELAQTVQELAAPAGFDIDLKGYTRDIYLSQYWMNVPLSITGWAGRPDPSMLLLLAFRGGGSWNESHIDNPKINALIDNISEEANEAKRLSYYHELQEVFYEEGSLIDVQVPLLIAVSNKIVNYRHPLTQIPQYKYMDVK
ncbi:MAG: ABC transporter substrate-binding protein [Sphaerochaetaceae bacterium]|nr:ABC transporter substrate-binding protein [Sphaerochaetaceae bacterium]